MHISSDLKLSCLGVLNSSSRKQQLHKISEYRLIKSGYPEIGLTSIIRKM